ncbi:MAG: F0F1 ATP synthase subunit delta [Candidatus Thermoplasmatota archaeon]|nr:hypothetical protein [Euryarchaeota archaeon]MBU4033030.1 F0F1 ATP synthase subunit delta [Candidatus Thermoplasmatota archaeon]MBU4071235.1 F0F1 ATP synthase subunit delta [Candidatus Thermoplasmatota archaeon]MBU4144728.1 F0F1 ATP synthase subunit delta [Candidatus Thermoplasmatota archaeon]MBU4591159.1 F0F1 ATP synthase subunit delta [Candidatus Thermoplasmatota archaeon]
MLCRENCDAEAVNLIGMLATENRIGFLQRITGSFEDLLDEFRRIVRR